MAFRGRDPIKCKIVINNKITEQINTYNYQECILLYEGQKYVTNKLKKKQIMEIIKIKF
jgi:hypothetical protein